MPCILFLAVPDSVQALRPEQIRSNQHRAGLEEALGLSDHEAQLLERLTRLARTFTQNYGLRLRPWQALWEKDWPQWRYVPGQKGSVGFLPRIEDVQQMDWKAILAADRDA